MSLVEIRPAPSRPASGDAPFDLDEVFFSRTDGRGVIASGNAVFRRVADYSWDQLIGAPHKLIRHPDMPRAVFWLMWQQTKAGRPIGAYVKNRARDGLAYWVFSVVTPIEGGYLSARIKPTSKLKAVIEAEYAALRAVEQAENLSPEASAARLLDRLRGLGFASYDLFAAHALSEELAARDAGMGEPADPEIRRNRAMLAVAAELRAETTGLAADFRAMRTIPHDMRVRASRLEPTGGPVSTLSKIYGASAQEMADWFARNVVSTDSKFAAIHGSVTQAMFLQCMARILDASCQQLARETDLPHNVDMSQEAALLTRLVRDFHNSAAEMLARVQAEADRIRAARAILHRHVLGLSSTRILCKIESGRMGAAGGGLEDIIAQLGNFQSRIGTRLDRIEAHSEAILAQLD